MLVIGHVGGAVSKPQLIESHADLGYLPLHIPLGQKGSGHFLEAKTGRSP